VEFWNKLNANERVVGIGAIVVIASWLVAVATGGAFGASLALLGAVAVLVIYYLKYSPTQNVNFPAPVPTLVLIVSGIAAAVAVLGALNIVTAFGAFASFLGLLVLSVIGTAVGAVVMAWGAWQEYQAMPRTTPPGGPTI
jgi:hypothetical protein